MDSNTYLHDGREGRTITGDLFQTVAAQCRTTASREIVSPEVDAGVAAAKQHRLTEAVADARERWNACCMRHVCSEVPTDVREANVCDRSTDKEHPPPTRITSPLKTKNQQNAEGEGRQHETKAHI